MAPWFFLYKFVVWNGKIAILYFQKLSLKLSIFKIPVFGAGSGPGFFYKAPDPSVLNIEFRVSRPVKTLQILQKVLSNRSLT